MAPSKSLLDSFREALSRRESKASRRRLTILPSGSVDFSSNDFLSLSHSTAFRSRFLQHVNSAPVSFPFSSGGSRLLDGNSAYAEDLESFIATFHDAPSGLLFNSGYDANVGVLSTVPQPGDVIVYDELIHASVHEGMRLSRAGKKVKFAHSSPQSLREVLMAEIRADAKIPDGSRNVFVVVESIYSMDGDVAPIREFVAVADEVLPKGNAYFIVDEAHATGVFGPNGAGVVQELGIQKRMFIRVHTFGKALASHGGTFAFPLFFRVRRDTVRLIPEYSNRSLLSRHKRLPYQLRPKSDLHHSTRLPAFSCNSNGVRAAVRRSYQGCKSSLHWHCQCGAALETDTIEFSSSKTFNI